MKLMKKIILSGFLIMYSQICCAQDALLKYPTVSSVFALEHPIDFAIVLGRCGNMSNNAYPNDNVFKETRDVEIWFRSKLQDYTIEEYGPDTYARRTSNFVSELSKMVENRDGEAFVAMYAKCSLPIFAKEMQREMGYDDPLFGLTKPGICGLVHSNNFQTKIEKDYEMSWNNLSQIQNVTLPYREDLSDGQKYAMSTKNGHVVMIWDEEYSQWIVEDVVTPNSKDESSNISHRIFVCRYLPKTIALNDFFEIQ